MPKHVHHYLPQFYQREWLLKDKFWRYERGHGSKPAREVQSVPRATAHERDLYTLHPDKLVGNAPSPDAVEDALADIEHAAKPLLARLTGRTGRGPLSLDERRAWAFFVCTLEMRHPEVLAMLDHQAPKNMRRMMAEQRKSLSTARDRAKLSKSLPPDRIKRLTSNMVRKTLANFVTNHDVTKRLMLQRWETITLNCPGSPEFLTSDRPIVFHSYDPNDRFARILMPLSPIHLFAGGFSAEELSRRRQSIADSYNVQMLERAQTWVISRRPVVGALREAVERSVRQRTASTRSP